MSKLWILIEKDLKLEFETKECLVSMFLFGLLTIVTFNFAIGASTEVKREVAPGVLWSALLFASVLGLNRSFVREKETGGIQGQMLCPVDRSYIYLAKVCANYVFALIVNLFILPLFVVFFNVPLWGVIGPFMLIFFLCTAGYVILGTLFSAVAVNTRMRDVMLPILLFPTITPVMIAAVKATTSLLNGDAFEKIQSWVVLVGAFDVIFLTVGLLTIEFVLEE